MLISQGKLTRYELTRYKTQYIIIPDLHGPSLVVGSGGFPELLRLGFGL